MSKHKNRLPPFVPLLISTIDSRAWRAMSHVAKSLYVALRRRVPNGRNRAFISHRQAEIEIKATRRIVARCFKELEHYGFIVLAQHGCLGVDGKGKSPHWRLTELGQIRRASANDAFEPPTSDFLRWDGTPFRTPKKQNPGSHGSPPWFPRVATGGSHGSPPKCETGSHGGAIEQAGSGSHGGAITSLPLRGSVLPASGIPEGTQTANAGDFPELPTFLDRRRVQ
jgi:hypothetical protein